MKGSLNLIPLLTSQSAVARTRSLSPSLPVTTRRPDHSRGGARVSLRLCGLLRHARNWRFLAFLAVLEDSNSLMERRLECRFKCVILLMKCK